MHQLPAFRSGRCLIPASGFCEWRKQPGGGKVPVWVHRADGKPIAFAGIVTGEEHRAAAIITTEPNSLRGPIHHRMPVVLEPEDWEQWLHDDSRSPELRALLLSREWPGIALRSVSAAVNSAGNDGPELVADDPAPTSPMQERLL